jgi:hypothetical protein
MHPYLASELIRDRQPTMLARAEQQRAGRKLRGLARASRRTEQPSRLVPWSLLRSRRAVVPS